MSTALAVGVPIVARAATYLWDSDASPGNGATDGGGPWTSGAITFINPSTGLEIAAGSTDTAVFGNGGFLSSPANVSVGAQTIGGLVFGMTTGNGYSLAGNGSGQVLTIGSNGILMTPGAQAATVGDPNLSLTLGASETWTNSSSNSLTIAGSVINNSNALTLSANSGGGISVTGGISGPGGVTVNSAGSGVATLSGQNTYTGATIVNAGALNLTGANATTALGINGGSLALSAGVLSASAVSFGGGSLTTASQTLGSPSMTAGASSSLTVTGNSTLSLGGGAWNRGADSILNVNLSAAGSGVTIAGLPSGAGAPTGTSNVFGYILVTDSSGVTGLGQFSGGTLQRFNSATAVPLTGSSDDAGTDFSTLNTVYTSGQLDWSNGNTLGARSVNSLTIDTSKTFGGIFLGGDAASPNPAVLTITGGALVFQGVNGNETISGGQIGAYNSELDIHQLATGTGTLTISSVLVSPGGSFQSGVVSNSVTVSGLATTSGLFVGESVTGSNIPAGDTIASIINGTTITLTSSAITVGATATVPIDFAPGAGSVVKDGNGTLVLGGAINEIGNLSGTAIGLAGTSGLYVGELVSGPGIAPGTTITSIGAGSVTLSASATSSGNASITFGTQSAYSGNTYIDAGTLQAGGKNVLSPNSTFVLANTAGAVLDLNGFDQIIGGLSGGGNVMLTNGATLTVGGGFSASGNNYAANMASTSVWNTYSGLLSGTGNLALTGGEVLYLTNPANSYSGFTDILSGSLVINNMGELGTSNTTITVAGLTSTSYTGGFYPGGTLVLQGGNGNTGLTVSRNIDISGGGVGENNDAGNALVTIGNNTFTGILSMAPNTVAHMTVVNGTTIFSSSSTLYTGTDPGDELQLSGAGNLIINGLVTGGFVGDPSIYRWSLPGISGEVVLNNPNNSFIGEIKLTAGFLGVSAQGDLGEATDTASIVAEGGTIDFRADPVNVNFDLKTIVVNGSTTVIAARSVGGAGINQTLTFGGGVVGGAAKMGFYGVQTGFDSTTSGSSVTITFGSSSDGSGNDGFGVTLNGGAAAAIPITIGTIVNFTSNLNGLLTINGSPTTSDGVSRAYAITSTGDILLNGSILNTFTDDAQWSKAGVGTLAIAGTASNNSGAFTIKNGAVAVNGMGAFNAALGGGVLLGSTTNASINYVGASSSGTGETSATAVINSISTANLYAAILGNQQQNAANTSATPLILTSSIAATGAVSKNFYLGGYNNSGGAAVVNQIQGILQDNSTTNVTSLVKGGSGSWLYAPAPASYATGAPAGVKVSSGGAVSTNSFVVSSAVGLVVGESVTGTNIPTNSIITAINGSTIFINNNIATALTASTALTFGTVGLAGAAGENFTGSVTVSGGTLQVAPTAPSGNGSAPLSASNAIVFNTDSFSGNGYAGGTFQYLGSTFGLTQSVGALTPAAGAGTILVTNSVTTNTATLNFASLGTRGTGAVLDFAPGPNSAISFATAPALASGIIGGYAYFTNSVTGAVDFATVTGNTVAAYSGYTTGLPASASSSSVNYLSNASVTTTAAESVNSLKLAGAQTLNLGGVLTIGTGGLLFDDSTGAATIAALGSSAFTLGAAASELIVTVAGTNSTNALTISAPIGSGSASLTKAGSGVLIISGANTFTGNVILDEGTIQLSGANATLGAISTAGNVTTLRQNTVLDLNAAGPGGVVTIGALTGAGTITNSGGAASTLNIGAQSTTTVAAETFSGLLQDGAGVLNVTKNGSGTQYLNPLNGAFTSTGSSAGSATLSATTSLSASVNVSNTAGLFVGEVVTGPGIAPGTAIAVINSGTSITLSQPATAAGNPTLNFGTNLSTLGTIGFNTYSGVTTIAEGTLSVTSLANYGSVSGIGTGLAQGNAASLVLGSPTTTGILQYTGATANNIFTSLETPSVGTNRLFTLAGNGGIDSSGTYGSAALSGATTQNNAALWFTNTAPVAFSTPGAKTLTLQGSSTGDNEIDLQLINNTVDGSTLSVTKASNGTWVLGNTNNIYSGPTTITAGALRAQDAGENATAGVTTAPTVASNILTVSSVFNASGLPITFLGTAGLSVGQSVSGPGIASGTIITSILSGTQIQISTADTVPNGASLTFGSINSLSPNSNLTLNGGVLESTGIFTRSLGTGAGQVQWSGSTANGGFAASSGPLVVAIGGLANPAPLVFGTASFTSGTFMLGSVSALSDTTVMDPIDLNGSAHTIAVTDNPTVGTDIYALNGVISGRAGSSLTLTAGALLSLNAANTYSGNTTITGNVVVSSIGSGGPSSAFGDSTGQLNLGNGTTTGAYLLYTGAGETTTRSISLNTTTATNTIDSSGSGALIIDSITNPIAGAKTLTLRGMSNDANAINAVLTNSTASGGGVLSITKTDGGSWILNGANTFTGSVTVTDGWLTIGAGWSTVANSAPNPLGENATAPLILNNGSLQTLNPTGTTFNSPVEIVEGAQNTIGGLYSINLNAGVIVTATSGWELINNVAQGSILTIGGTFQWTGSESAKETFEILGTGNTILNAALPINNNGFAFNLQLDSIGTLTINTPANNTGGFTLTQGTVYLNTATPFGTSAGTLTIAGGTIIAGLNLTAANNNSQILNPVALSSNLGMLAGINSIEFAGTLSMSSSRELTNNLSGNAQLILSNSIAISNTGGATFTLTGSGNTLISGAYVAGSGACDLQYSGIGSSTLTLTGTNTYYGSTTLSGGSTILSGAAGEFGFGSSTTASAADAGSATLTVTSAVGLVAGEPVVGPGVPTGTTIASISGSSLTLSQPATVAKNAVLNFGGTSGIEVDPTTVLTLDNTGGNASANRLGNHPLTLSGGALTILGNSNGTTEGTAVNPGSLTIATGQSVITLTNNGGNTILNFGGLVQTSGSTLDLESNLALGTGSNQINLGQAVTASVATSTTTLLVSSTAGLYPGEPLSGFGIPDNTTISSVTNSTTLVLSQAPIIIPAGEAIEFGVPLAGATFITANGLLPRVTIGGNTWATYGSNGLTPFTAYNTAAHIFTDAVSDVVEVNNNTSNIGASSTTLPGPKTFDALAIMNSGTNATISGDGPLTLTSGGILVTGGNDTLNFPAIHLGSTAAPVEGIFQIASGASLNVEGSVTTNPNGFTKGLGGNLTFSSTQFFTGGANTLNGGVTQLNAGTNTLYPGVPLTINAGATLDLNGSALWSGVFGSGNGGVPGAGGTITSTNGPALLVSNGGSAGGTWAGSITGNSSGNVVSFAYMSVDVTFAIQSANPYYGSTYFLGAVVALEDNGTLSNTSSILLNGSVFSISNEADLFINNNNRVNPAAPITMNASTLALTGLANANTTAMLGALTLASGANIITASTTATGIYGSADLTFASINHNPDATVNFTSTGTLGSEGENAAIYFANTSGLNYNANTGMIGPWAFAGSDTWAAYNPSLGVGAVGTAGYPSYSAGSMAGGTATVSATPASTAGLTIYSGGALVGFGPGNVTNISGGNAGQNQVLTLPAGGANTDYLRFAGVAENDLAFTNATDVLTLNQGGLMHSNSGEGSTIIGTPAIPGILTVGGSGAQELVVYDTTNNITQTGAATNGTVINSNILTVGSTAGVFAGEAVTGTGIPTGAFVTSVLSGTQVTINYNATSTSASQTLTFLSNMVINSSVADNGAGSQTRLNKSGTGTLALTSGTTELIFGASLVNGQSFFTVPAGFATFAGETVSGPGLPTGTTIVAVGVGATTNQILLSNGATLTGASNVTFGAVGASTTSGSVGNTNTVTNLASTAGLYIGEPVFGANIPAGALVASVLGGNSITLTSATTGGANPASQPLTFGVSGGNSYSGGTVVNNGILDLDGAAPGTVTIPAGNLTIVGPQDGVALTIVNVGVTEIGGVATGIGGQFDPSTVINIIGKSTLNLAGINSINSLNFNNNGGDGVPTVALASGSVLNLTNSTPIIAASNNVATVAILSGGTVIIPAGVNTFNIGDIQLGGVDYTNIGSSSGTVATLNITSAIAEGGQGTSINKTGNGLLQLGGASTFDSGVDVMAGGLIIGASSTPSTVGSTPTSGPLGTGTLTIGPGTTLLASGTDTVANAVIAQGDLIFNGTNTLTLNGAVSLQTTSGNENITVVNPAATAVIGGFIGAFNTNFTPLATLTKLGLGALSLTGTNNTFSGSSVKVLVDAGSLFVANDGSLGPSYGSFTSNAIVIQDGADFGANNATAVIAANRGISMGSGGGFFANSSATAILTVNGVVTDNGQGVYINGPGVTAFNANEAFGAAGSGLGIQGNIYVTGGAFRAIDGQGLPAGSNLVLNGGVLETNGIFTRALGSGPGQVEIVSGSSGFSANTGAGLTPSTQAFSATIDLGGNGTGTGSQLVWGSAFFNPTAFVVNDTTSNTDVFLLNAIDLNNTGAPVTRTITVNANTGFLNGSVSNSNGSVSIVKNGAGILVFNNSNNTFTGNILITAGTVQLEANNEIPTTAAVSLTGGALGFGYDGDGTGSIQTDPTPFTQNVTFASGGAIAVGQIGVGIGNPPLFTTATNKIIQYDGTITYGTGFKTIQVNNNNGDELEILSNATLNLPSSPVINVATATNSNVLQGLALDVQLTGSLALTKSGAGTLVLQAAGGNPFTGSITIGQGVVSVASDNELGASSAVVFLTPIASATSTLRATGTFSTARVIEFGTVASSSVRAIEVTNGNKLTLTSAFNLDGGAGNTAALVKNDLGTLVLSAANSSSWTGTVTVNGGVLELTNGSALGAASSGVTVASAFGAAVQVANSITVADPIALNATGTAGGTGINNQGALESVSGNNVWSGLISLNVSGSTTGDDAWIGADAGSSLTITGGITQVSTNVHSLNFTGAGNITVTTNALGSGTGVTWGFIDKFGTGALNVQVPVANLQTSGLTVFNGTFDLSGGGILGTGTSDAVSVFEGPTGSNGIVIPATLLLDNSTSGYLTNRLASNNLTLFGGNLSYIVNGASASIETIGILTLGTGGATINLGGSNSLANVLTFTSLTANAGSTVNFTGNLGNASNEITFTTPPALVPAGNGILAKGTVASGSNFDFATYNLTTGVTAFSGYNQSTTTDINATATTDTIEITNSNFGVSTTLNSPRTLNALAIDGTGLSVGGAPETALTLTSGGILVNGASSAASISVPMLAFGSVEGIFHINTGSTLNISSVITGTAGITKADAGAMTLNAADYNTGTVTVNAGTLTLGGGINTLNYTSTLTVNGGIVELAGDSQTVGLLESGNNNASGNGGIVQSTIGAAQATFAVNTGTSADNFDGQINGNLYFSRAGTSTLQLTNTSAFTGGALLTGGTTTLINQGAFSATTSVTLEYATLTLNNQGQAGIASRIPTGAPIQMNGSTLSFLGRQQTASTETVGVVTLNQGLNTINSANGGTGSINSADLTLSGFGVTAGMVNGFSDVNGNGAAVNFTTASGTTLGISGSGARIGILNGANPLTPAALVSSGYMVNNIIPWAVVGGTDFASYITYTSVNGVSAGGIGALSTTGYAGYDNTSLPSSSAPTQNVRLTASQTLPSTVGNPIALTINSLNLNGSTDLNFLNNTDTLNLTSGGFLRNSAGLDFIGGLTTDNGNVTAGGAQATGVADLYLYNNQGSLTIDSAIINNPNGAVVRLVISGAGTTTLGFNNANAPAGATYSLYSGGLVVNGGTVNLTNNTVLPGGNITLNATTFNTSASSAIGVSTNTAASAADNDTTTLAVFSTANVFAGEGVSGSGIPSGTTVVSVSGNTVTLSQAATIPNPGTPVTFNGALPFFTLNNSTLGLFDSLTVAGLAFNSSGSNGNLVTLNNMVLTLPSNGSGITSTPTSVSTNDIATINSGTSPGYLSLNGIAQTFTVMPTLINGVNMAPLQSGLTITAIIVDNLPLAPNGLGVSGTTTPAGSIVLTGGGALQLSGASTFSGGVDVQGGTSLIVAASSTPATVGSAVTSGPVGTGALTLENGAILFASAATNTIANAVNVNGNFTFGGAAAANSLNLAGPVNLGNLSPSITVTSPQVAAKITGVITSTSPITAFTKQGAGILVLGNASENFGGAGVIVGGGALQNGVPNAIPINSLLTVNAGAAYDLNGFGQNILQIAGAGFITDSGGAATLLVGGTTITDAATPNTINSVFTGSITNNFGTTLAITKSGLGALTLAGTNTYSGATNVNVGTIIVSGTINGSTSINIGTGSAAAAVAVTSAGTLGSAASLAHVAVASKSTLSGNGTINASSVTVSNGGTIAPASGDSNGLTINSGPLTLSSGSTFQLSLTNSNAASSGAPALADYSKLTLASGATANINGANIAVNLTGSANVDDLFTIILNGGSAVSGTFANSTRVNGSASTYAFTSNGQQYEINYAFNGADTASLVSQSAFEANTGGSNVALLLLAVPEPNSWSMLLGSVGLALGLQRFRRRRK